MHTNIGFIVWHPHCRMMFYRLFAACNQNKMPLFKFIRNNAGDRISKTYSFSINPLYIYLYEPSIPVFLCLLLHIQRMILSLCELTIHYDILQENSKKKKTKIHYYYSILVNSTEMDPLTSIIF